MESVGRIVGEYAKGESQKDSPMAVSLRPFFRKGLMKLLSKKHFWVMELGKQPSAMVLGNWKRNRVSYKKFTDGGRLCLKRFQAQVDLRLPEFDAEQSIIPFNDPTTKQFLDLILVGKKKEKAVSCLKKSHRKMYRIAFNKFANEPEKLVMRLQ